MNQLWQYWTGDFQFVDRVHAIASNFPIAQTSLGYKGERQSSDYRSCTIKWLPVHEPDIVPIADQLMMYAKAANRNAFGFDINYLNDIQYTEYNASDNGHYNWHVDTFWANPTTYDRKISIVVQLSDPNDYEGGDFLFDPQHPQPDPTDIRQKGSVIIFPSFISHCVTPVTRGTRRSLVSWIEGPKFR